ncbi:MAG: serine--tRNA ligase [Pseudomonadota bacterium]
MLDLATLRKNLMETAAQLALRGYRLDTEAFSALESARKQLQIDTEALRQKRNDLSGQIGRAKAQKQPTDALMAEVGQLGDVLAVNEHALAELLAKQEAFCLMIPNLTHASVPVGKSEHDNVEVRRVGTPKTFSFTPMDHTALGELAGLIDFETAAKLSGSRFVVLRRQVARLHRALIQFMLDTHIQHGYQEMYVPYLVNETTLRGTGQLPHMADDLFKTNDERGLYLIPTAEVSLTNLVRDAILNGADLPLRFVAHSPCFRKEAGSYGKDTRGMIRQHQFEKVELVHIDTPDRSYESLEQMVSHAESILQKLELPYRVLSLCTGDIGFGAAKTYDLEVWLPSQNTYREISSCSNTEAYQARRMMTRFRDAANKLDFVHTLNGSGVAVGRCLIAVLENYQDEAHNIAIPTVLQPYMGGLKTLSMKE